MHINTGTVDTAQGWMDSYMEEELEQRGLTAGEAFIEDEGVTLFEVEERKKKKSAYDHYRERMAYGPNSPTGHGDIGHSDADSGL